MSFLDYRSPQNSHFRSFQQSCIATAVSTAFAFFYANPFSLPCMILMGDACGQLTHMTATVISCHCHVCEPLSTRGPCPALWHPCSPRWSSSGSHSPAVPGMGKGVQGRQRLQCCRENTEQKLPAEGSTRWELIA